MAPKSPFKASKILATPINNLEESRAQRLQRQQSRFRDRGGIFVPSSRNTLADILLGKVSPIKKPRRSASLSPSKAQRRSATEKPKSIVRETSPHEQNLRRSPRKKGRTLAVISEAGGTKPVSKVSLHSASKALAAVPSEAITPGNTSTEVDDNPAPVKKSSRKKTPARRAKKPSPPKSKAAKSTKKVVKPERQEESEPQRKKKSVANSTSAKSQAASSAKSSGSKKMSANATHDEECEEEDVTRSGRKKSVANRKSSSSNKRSSSRTSVPTKPRTSNSGARQLSDIMEEDEDEALPPPPEHSLRNKQSAKARGESKGPAAEEDPSTDPADPPCVKPNSTEPKARTSKPRIAEDEPSPPQRKRRRTVEQEEGSDVEGKTGKPAKRKKVSAIEKIDEKAPLELKKRPAKPARSKPAPEAQAKKAATKTAKRKENFATLPSTQMETPQVSVPQRGGIPKSVLRRLQNSSAPHVVDDEPDPIDFLS